MIYNEKVTRLVPVEAEESIEVPAALVKLVRGRDKKYGANGYHYLGCERQQQGGYIIDRLRAYVAHHFTYHVHYGQPCNCPVKL